MTGAEALAIHAAAQDLLRRQTTAVSGGDLDAAEALGAEIGRLLDRVTRELGAVDDAMREPLLLAARTTASELAAGVAALDQAKRQRINESARAERDGAAIKRYLPTNAAEPARFLDERR